MHKTHDRRVIFRRDYLFGNVGYMFNLRNGLIALRNVHVHLIAVEIGIVGRTHRQIQSEGIVGEYSNSMTHHAHPVECGLPVENDIISILETPLDYHSIV